MQTKEEDEVQVHFQKTPPLKISSPRIPQLDNADKNRREKVKKARSKLLVSRLRCKSIKKALFLPETVSK